MLLKNPPVSPGVESPIVKIHWWPSALLRRIARNSFRRAANQKSGSENSRKEMKVEAWSTREDCFTAETTPTMTASTTATAMASDTTRAGTNRGVPTRRGDGRPRAAGADPRFPHFERAQSWMFQDASSLVRLVCMFLYLVWKMSRVGFWNRGSATMSFHTIASTWL